MADWSLSASERQYELCKDALKALLWEASPKHKLRLARKAVRNLLGSSCTPISGEEIRPEVSEKTLRNGAGGASLRPCPWDCSALPPEWKKLPKVPAREKHFSICTPHNLPKRKSPFDPQGAAMLIHALAQIELAAIEIDAAQILLYPTAPDGWQRDMLRIIADECDHFEALAAQLEAWGHPYGTWPIHHALWNGFLEGKTWLEHLALTTRYQEANGVDASRELLTRMASAPKGVLLNDTLALLEKLHLDEIRHVAIGSRWWHFAFEQGGVWPSLRKRDEAACAHYFSIIEKRVQNPWSRRFPFYLEGRSQAGFTEAELAVFKDLQTSRLGGVAKPSKKRQEQAALDRG